LGSPVEPPTEVPAVSPSTYDARRGRFGGRLVPRGGGLPPQPRVPTGCAGSHPGLQECRPYGLSGFCSAYHRIASAASASATERRRSAISGCEAAVRGAASPHPRRPSPRDAPRRLLDAGPRAPSATREARVARSRPRSRAPLEAPPFRRRVVCGSPGSGRLCSRYLSPLLIIPPALGEGANALHQEPPAGEAEPAAEVATGCRISERPVSFSSSPSPFDPRHFFFFRGVAG